MKNLLNCKGKEKKKQDCTVGHIASWISLQDHFLKMLDNNSQLFIIKMVWWWLFLFCFWKHIHKSLQFLTKVFTRVYRTIDIQLSLLTEGNPKFKEVLSIFSLCLYNKLLHKEAAPSTGFKR